MDEYEFAGLEDCQEIARRRGEMIVNMGQRIHKLEQEVERLRSSWNIEVDELSRELQENKARLTQLVERLKRIRPHEKPEGFGCDAFINGQVSGWNLCLKKVKEVINATQERPIEQCKHSRR